MNQQGFNFDPPPEAEIDVTRPALKGQLWDIFDLMSDARYRTLKQIAKTTGHPEASISAQLRRLKSAKYGGNKLSKRRKGGKSWGTYEYRLKINREKA